MALKVDIRKAYDSVSWSFLMDIMRRMVFGTGWIQWIKAFFTSARYSVIINGAYALS